MAVTHKNRRKINVNGRLFLWSLHEEDVNELHIVSDDKRLNLRYGWQHSVPPGWVGVDLGLANSASPRLHAFAPSGHCLLRESVKI